MKRFIFFIILATNSLFAQERFKDNFEGDLSKWDLNSPNSTELIDSGDPIHGKVLQLTPNGNVSALIKNSNRWGAIRLEGEMLFPEKGHSYLGFIYNYNQNVHREDFGVLYIKGNGNYIRANPWRDGNVSRLMYEEYKTKLLGDQIIKIGQWHKFKLEVINKECHLYINDMILPKITFDLFEHDSGKIGFQPRVNGTYVWLDNISVSSIDRFSYKGPHIPDIDYQPDSLITDWEVLGPLNKSNIDIERSFDNTSIVNEKLDNWQPFETDKRGAIITGRITEYEGENTIAYFRTFIHAENDKTVSIHFTTIDELTLYLNGSHIGRIYRDGYISKENDWNAWYDFWHNPSHYGRKQKINLKKGLNQILIKVRNGQFASGGFFAYLEDK